MIILTEKGIANFGPIRQSQSRYHAWADWTIAEVPDDFSPSEEEMEEAGIDFWWELSPGHFDYEDFEQTNECPIKSIMWSWGIGKPVNIAMAIHTICNDRNLDPIVFFDNFETLEF